MPATAKPLFYAPGIPMPKVPAHALLSIKAVVLDSDGSCLMQRRPVAGRGKRKATQLVLFGGGAKRGEPVISALQRELCEEIRAIVHPDEVKCLMNPVVRMTHERGRPERKLTIYTLWQNSGALLTQCYEHKMERYASIEEALRQKNVTRPTQAALQRALEI